MIFVRIHICSKLFSDRQQITPQVQLLFSAVIKHTFLHLGQDLVKTILANQ